MLTFFSNLCRIRISQIWNLSLIRILVLSKSTRIDYFVPDAFRMFRRAISPYLQFVYWVPLKSTWYVWDVRWSFVFAWNRKPNAKPSYMYNYVGYRFDHMTVLLTVRNVSKFYTIKVSLILVSSIYIVPLTPTGMENWMCWIKYDCLFGFSFPTTSNRISGWTRTCDNVQSLWPYRSAPLKYEANGTMHEYPTQSYCPVTELISPCQAPG